MTKLQLTVAAAAIALAPALAISTLAAAESAIPRILEVHTAQAPLHSADDVDLSKPGDARHD